MKLDIVDDGDLYNRSLEEVRWEILQGADVRKDWHRIQERHPFFRDVVVDAERQARLLSSLLVAMEFFIHRLLWCFECGTPPSFVDSRVVGKWRASLTLFLSLYELSPVPTRVRWAEEVRRRDDTIDVQDYADDGDQEENEDDGSFVEARLKELVVACVSSGRVWCRHLFAEGDRELAEKIRRSVSIMESFVAPRTLEW